MSKLWASAAKLWQSVARIDPRGLWLLRTALGLLVIFDLVTRIGGTELWLSDTGLLPRSVLAPDHWRIPVYRFTGDAQVLVGVTLVHALIGLAIAVGFYPRIASLICLIFYTSMHARNSFVLTGGDGVVRILLFWSALLPSFAQARAREEQDKTSVAPLLPFLLAQIVMLYWAAGISKLVKSAEWRQGLGSCGSLLSSEYVTWIGIAIRKYCGPGVDLGLFIVEILLVLLVFVSIKKQWLRLAVVLVFCALHVGFFVALGIHLFSMASLLWWLPLLPPRAFDALQVRGLFPTLASPPPPTPAPTWVVRSRFAFAALITVLVAWWNLSTFPQLGLIEPRPLVSLGLGQSWHLFARSSWRTGFVVIPGLKNDGTVVDLAKGGLPLTFAQPAHIADLYSGDNDRAFYRHLLNEQPKWLSKAVAQSWCRRDPTLTAVRVYALRQPYQKDLRGYVPVQYSHLLADVKCASAVPSWPAWAVPATRIDLNGKPAPLPPTGPNSLEKNGG